MQNTNKSRSEILNDERWPVVAFRMKREEFETIQRITGEPSYGKAVKSLLRSHLDALRKSQDFSSPEVMQTDCIPKAGKPAEQAELQSLRDSRKVSEAEFRMFFKRLRAVGQRDATPENEAAFWNHLLATDRCREDGTPVDRNGLRVAYAAWLRLTRRPGEVR